MTAPLISLGSGALMLAVAARLDVFERVFGPGMAAQHMFESRLPNLKRTRTSYRTRVAVWRVFVLVFGMMLFAVGAFSLIQVVA